MISTRSVGLLIDTVVCLTLAKWETVSGRFGGYIRPASGVVPQAERSNRNQRSNCNQRGVQRVPRQPDLRKVDRLLGLQYASLEETPPKEQVLAAAVSDDASSFDHLVGAGEQRERESDAERLGSLEINDQLHLRDFQPCVLTQRQLQLLEPR